MSSALLLFPCGQFCGRSTRAFARVCREPRWRATWSQERGSGRKAARLRAPGRPLQAMPEAEAGGAACGPHSHSQAQRWEGGAAESGVASTPGFTRASERPWQEGPRVSLCSSGCSEAHYVGQAGIRPTEIHLRLPSEGWNERHFPDSTGPCFQSPVILNF